MDQIAYSSSCTIGDTHEYLYPVRTASPLAASLASTSGHPYTVTPPESLASGVREFGHEDVGRLSDVLEDERERLDGNAGEIAEIKDVILLDDTTEASGAPVPMVHVSPNKVSLCEGDSRSASKGPSPSAKMYLKDVMKEILVNISTTGNVPELMVLEGANGGVVIHKTIIAYYSKLVREQLTDHPDCSIVYLPNYSIKIIRKVVEILYTGETFYSEEEKKDVNLIWDAMRQLQISFDDKAFFYHPVEYTAVKEDVDGEESQQDQSITVLDNQVEVDQTDECWHEDQTSSEAADVWPYVRVVRQPHPENPSKSVYIQSKYGEGRKIQRSMPAMVHVNADEIQEREKIENRKLTEQLLQKHKPLTIDLVEAEEKAKNSCSNSNKKKKRKQSYVIDTGIIEGDNFRDLLAAGKVERNMVEAVTLTSRHQSGETCDVQPNELVSSEPSAAENQESHTLVQFFPETLTVESGRIPSVIIPPNRPEGTGIAFVQRSPGSSNESISEMPKLHRVSDHDHQVAPKRVRRRSADITDIPKLDKICEDPLIRDNTCDVTGNATNGHLVPGLATAALVPVSKVNQFMISQSQHTNFTITNSSTEPQPGTSDSVGAIRKARIPRRRPPKIGGVSEEEIQQMKEEYRKREKRNGKLIVIASKKVPIEHNDLKVDEFIENMGVDDDDYRIRNAGNSVKRAINNFLDCPTVNSRDASNRVPSKGVSNTRVSANVDLVVTTRNGGRDLRQCRTKVQQTEFSVYEEDGSGSEKESERKIKRPTRGGKSRRGSRRGRGGRS